MLECKVSRKTFWSTHNDRGGVNFAASAQITTLRLLNALNSEDRGLKVRFSLATIAFDRESAQMSQILSSQGKNAPSNPYPHYLVRLATSKNVLVNLFLTNLVRISGLSSLFLAIAVLSALFAREC